MAVKIYPVIMCGGAGTRLWPLSSQARPKQFHALTSNQSLLQETMARFQRPLAEGFDLAAPLIIANAAHEALILEQASALGMELSGLVLEPMGRNTAPVAHIAAKLVEEQAPEALALLLPADHHISKPDAFHAALADGAAAAAEGRLVTIGVTPTFPATGYGYIKRGGVLGPIFEVDAFVEKPDEATAKSYIAAGDYAWNAGVFLFAPKTLMSEMTAHAPAIAAGAETTLAAARRDGVAVRLEVETFKACPADSIDYAVMEKTDRAAVAPADMGWNDVGSWQALWELGDKDDAGNVTAGDVHLAATKGCYVDARGPKVAALGVDDLVIVATGDEVLVAKKSDPAAVGALAKRLRERE